MTRTDVICFGGNDWWYHNRNHMDLRVTKCMAANGTLLYINSIVMQKPNLTKGKRLRHRLSRKLKSICKGLCQIGPGIWVYSPFTLPVHHVASLRLLNRLALQFQLRLANRKVILQNPIVWVACPVACDVAVRMKRVRLVYQRSDRFEEYPNVDADTVIQYDRRLKSKADLTVFVNETLYKQERHQCNKATFLDHGVEFDMFASAEASKYLPPDIRDIKKPIVGFFGGIDDHTSDIHLVQKVADLLPQVNIVFIGAASVDCSGLLSRKNVWMLGQKPYQEIPHYGKYFDVAIMPWRQNRWIEACNPIKLKEYLALGKPIVSTPFAELQKYRDVVFEAKTPREFADCIKKGLQEDNIERIAARRKKVETSTWDSKAQLVLMELFGKDGDF